MSDQFFYTFRDLGGSLYEVTKWEEYESLPVETYEIKKKHRAFYCSCPAHVPFCKHIDMLSEMVECECIEEHWLWYFDKNGWQSARDFDVFYIQS